MSTVKFRSGIEFKRYVAGKMELERADKRFFPDKPKAMGDMVAREKSMMDFLEANMPILGPLFRPYEISLHKIMQDS